MKEIKISTQVKSEKCQKIAVKLDLQSMGFQWDNETFVRVMSYPKQNKIVLQRVANKYPKQVTYKVTNTAGAHSAHQKGIYITQKHTRFAKLASSASVEAAARIVGDKIEIYLPQEIFAQQ